MARRFDWDREMGYIDEVALYEHQDELVYERRTPGVKRWLKIIDDPRVPGPGKGTVVVLLGKTHNILDDLGVCIPERVKGEHLSIIALADPDPEEVHGLFSTFRHYLPKSFPNALLKQAWDAWLMFTYLHELGHARRFLKQGTSGSEFEHEDAANTYAFRQLEKICDPLVVAASMALMWVGDEGGDL